MSTLLFFAAAMVLSAVLRWLLTGQARWVQAGLWVAAMAGLLGPLYLNLGQEPAVRELVWPFAAGLVAGERFVAWLQRPGKPRDSAGTAAKVRSKNKS